MIHCVMRQIISGLLNSQNRPLELLNIAFGKGIGQGILEKACLCCLVSIQQYFSFSLCKEARPEKRDAVQKMNFVSLEKSLMKSLDSQSALKVV
jgi:hypothetical protein